MNRFLNLTVVIAVVIASASALPARAYEAGYPGTQVLPGISIGGTTASTPGPGVYMFNQVSTYQASIVGPGAPKVGGSPTAINVNTAGAGILWVPGWEFLGAKYDAVFVQPVAAADTGAPVSTMKRGLHNSTIFPIELSWKLGESGFFIKTGFGVGVPDGTINGANGLGDVGNPWWTFRPEFIVSYLKDGWNFTAAAYGEINTENSITHYRSGNVLDVEFAATKTIGRWTIGAIGYYVGQVGSDTSSAYYNYVINSNRFNVWAAGGLVGYDFGPATLKVWVADEFSANASGGTPLAGVDRAGVGQGIRGFASVSYRLWAPDEPASDNKPRFYK